jgi:hypothetical protein
LGIGTGAVVQKCRHKEITLDGAGFREAKKTFNKAFWDVFITVFTPLWQIGNLTLIQTQHHTELQEFFGLTPSSPNFAIKRTIFAKTLLAQSYFIGLVSAAIAATVRGTRAYHGRGPEAVLTGIRAYDPAWWAYAEFVNPSALTEVGFAKDYLGRISPASFTQSHLSQLCRLLDPVVTDFVKHAPKPYAKYLKDLLGSDLGSACTPQERQDVYDSLGTLLARWAYTTPFEFVHNSAPLGWGRRHIVAPLARRWWAWWYAPTGAVAEVVRDLRVPVGQRQNVVAETLSILSRYPASNEPVVNVAGEVLRHAPDHLSDFQKMARLCIQLVNQETASSKDAAILKGILSVYGFGTPKSTSYLKDILVSMALCHRVLKDQARHVGRPSAPGPLYRIRNVLEGVRGTYLRFNNPARSELTWIGLETSKAKRAWEGFKLVWNAFTVAVIVQVGAPLNHPTGLISTSTYYTVWQVSVRVMETSLGLSRTAAKRIFSACVHRFQHSQRNVSVALREPLLETRVQ